jgi:rSAM/selenodomain-associated transferase 2
LTPTRLGACDKNAPGSEAAFVLSVVIPVLNAEASIAERVGAWLESGVADEVVVADGGSLDASVDLAQIAGARVVVAPKGRGSQMAAGAQAANGDWLLFMHADTRLGPGWQTVTKRFMADPANIFRAGYYRFALDDPRPAARRLERVVAWRCRWLGLPYGDQGLLIGADFYERLGGYEKIPLMEDVALVRKIPGHRLEALPADAVTSAARYRQDGYLLRPARNMLCLALYYMGVPPAALVDIYQGPRR